MADPLFLATLPLLALAALSDLRSMTIPNGIPIALLLLFVLLGPVCLPWTQVAIGLGAGLAALAIGVLLWSGGQIGGGDVKLFASIVLFISPAPASFAMLLAASTLASLALHRLTGLALRRAGLAQGWASFHAPGLFPFGLPLAVAGILQLSGLVPV